MSDLVKRLREMSDPSIVGAHFNPLYADAANEIERLQMQVSRLKETQRRLFDQNAAVPQL